MYVEVYLFRQSAILFFKWWSQVGFGENSLFPATYVDAFAASTVGCKTGYWYGAGIHLAGSYPYASGSGSLQTYYGPVHIDCP